MQLPRFLALACVLVACGGDDGVTSLDPTDVAFGDTALVVVLNPTINDANSRTVPAPGSARSGLVIRSDDGVADTTDEAGIAVLAPLTAGTRTFTVTGDGIDASFSVKLADGALHEIGLAVEGTRAELMADIDYKVDQVFEIVPTMTHAEVADVLRVSDRVVFVRGGTYTGDLELSGSRITLFGEGALGGRVVLDGNILLSGSDSRIRGTHITGDLDIPASGTGISFSRVDGALAATGSDTTLLANDLCGDSEITGSGSLVLDNRGVAPEGACR